MEKGPKFAAENNEDGKNKETALARAKEAWGECVVHDNQEVDRETHEKIKKQQTEVYQCMMRSDVSWTDCVEQGLPWDPRFELHKKSKLADNDNTESAKAAA